MSADNYIAIQKRDGKYYVWMDFASNDDPKPSKNANKFDTHLEAYSFARGWIFGEMIVEYGIQELNDYVTPKKKKIEQEILHVDATPDADYPLRILQAYRRMCDGKWSASSLEVDESNPIIKAMNELQDKRAKILDRAIQILKDYSK